MRKLARSLAVLTTALEFAYYAARGHRPKALEVMFRNFMDLGGVYVKFLQLTAIREDLDDYNYKQLKSTLAVFDDVAFEHIDITALVKEQLGAKASQIAHIDQKPFAQGSFAQVYAAELFTGEKVVIKVLRPSVQKNLHFDLKLLGFAARVVSFFKSNDFLDARQLFEELKEMTVNEIDYRAEATNANEIYEYFKNDPVLVIPKTFLELSTRNIIVQQRVNGVPLTELMKQDDIAGYIQENLNTDLSFVMEKLAYESLSASLEGRVTHGDPHPGNIFILPNNQVSLIDFGVYIVEVKRKSQLIRLLREYVHMYEGSFRPAAYTEAMVHFFVPDLMRALNNVGASINVDVQKQVADKLGEIVQGSMNSGETAQIAQTMIEKNQPLNLFVKIINRKNRFSIKADLESMILMRSTNMYLNLLNRLHLDRSGVKSAYKRIISENEEIEMSGFSSFDVESLDESYHIVSSWLDRLRYSDPASYVKLQEVIQ